ncbi:MAG: peptidase domain-containing ABC transporter [Rhodanobacteraceae bacterium]|nr:peptidase domain-containing ABC transporter [Rhodanobacteraceae bacterium]
MNASLQAEYSECGLACIAAVAASHGMHISLAEMRLRFPTSLRGARLNDLIRIADRIGLRARALRLEPEHLAGLQLPCILHWNLNHFVVLTKINTRRATIFDPAHGERSFPTAAISRHFSGVALELAPSAGFKPRAPRPSVSLSQLTGSVRGLKRALAQIFLVSLTLQLFVALSPFYLQLVVDQVLVSADRDLLVVLGIGFTLLLVLQTGVSVLRGWSILLLSSRFGVQWMSNIVSHLLRLPLDYFEKRQLGDITSRIGSVNVIQRTLTTSFVEAAIDGLMATTTIAIMMFYSVKLAMITLLAAGTYLVIRLVGFPRMREQTELQLAAVAKQQSHLLETIRGMQSVKIGSHEPLRRAAHENLLVKVANEEIRLGKMSLGFSNASQLVFGAERISVIWVGATLALSNVFSVGMLIAYLAYKELFTARIASLIDKCIEFRMLRLHAERLSDVILTPREYTEDAFEPPPPADARIVLSNVSFRYAPGEPWVVRDCSLIIEPGESVAITGPSGCGKTTLVKLMLGLLKPEEGTIVIGGHDVNAPTHRAARRVVGAVMQDDQLFAGSIAENISLFDPDPDHSRIEGSARLAAVSEEIAAMPMGYHSLIGDMGSALSGGQKQRVLLARALYRKPMVLFLDEATSHLDTRNEQLVNHAVREMRLTRVIVAHRPETIATADRVLRMENGCIVADTTCFGAVDRSRTEPEWGNGPATDFSGANRNRELSVQ